MKPVVPLTIDDSQNFRDWGFKHGTAPKLKKIVLLYQQYILGLMAVPEAKSSSFVSSLLTSLGILV